MIRTVVSVLVVLVAGVQPSLAFQASSPSARERRTETIREKLREASTCFWFTVAELGDLRTIDHGLSLLDQAEAMLDTDRGVKIAGETDLRLELDGLRRDLEQQREITHDTLYGVFPLIRLLAPTLFSDGEATGTFELIDEPEVVATCHAVEDLAMKILDGWKRVPQLSVVLNGPFDDTELENEALYIFHSSPRFHVIPLHDVTRILDGPAYQEFLRGDFTGEMAQVIFQNTQVSDLLSVQIRDYLSTGNDHLYAAEGRLYEPDRVEPVHEVLTLGFCRDRRAQLLPIILVKLGLLLAAVTLFAAIARARQWSGTGWLLVLVPAILFVVGHVVPWALIPVLEQIAPEPSALAVLSFWWPCLVGTALFLGAPFVARTGITRAGALIPRELVAGNWDVLLLPISAGTAAYLATPLFLYLEGRAIGVLPAIVLGIGAIGVMLGRIFDRRDPGLLAIVPTAGALALGGALFSLQPYAIWPMALTLAVVAVTRSLQPAHRNGGGPTTDPPGHPKGAPDPPADLGEMVHRTEAPPFVQFDFFTKIQEHVGSFLDSPTTVRLALVGESGTGKTATVNALVCDLQKTTGVDVLAGTGPHPGDDDDAAPFAPFQEALARRFNISMLAPPAEQLSQIDSALEGIFESVVPFSGLLFPPSSGAVAAPVSRDHVYRSICRALVKLAEHHPTVLFMDDVQWFDPASIDLLRYLLGEIPAGGPVQLLFVIASRDFQTIEGLGLEADAFSLPPLQPEQKVHLLVASCGLDEASAERIVHEVGGGDQSKGELFWLFHLVGHLARSGVLGASSDDGRWRLVEEYAQAETLPIPDEFRTALKDTLEQHPEQRELLQCAACLGLEFSASVLADALEMPRLKLLQALERVESDSGILIDVRESDDHFAFRSSIMLEVIRDQLQGQIRTLGPSAQVPQLIREYHARVAKTLAKNADTSSSTVLRVANHFYAAGGSHLKEARDYSLRAAHLLTTMFRYEEAHGYVDRADECSTLAGAGDVADEHLLIDCYRAHVENHPELLSEVAQRGLDRLEASKKASARLRIEIGRTCYQAAAAGERCFYEDAVRIALEVASAESDPLIRAEALQLNAISLPPSAADERQRLLVSALQQLVGGSDRTMLADLVDAAENVTGGDRECPSAVLSVLARVADSLAGVIAADRSRSNLSRRLYQLSIDIKRRPATHDLPGLARSLGGLGRLELWSLSDPNAGRRHFLEDLEISVEIGDVGGQIMMFSLLGESHLAEDDCITALLLYCQSHELATSPKDRFFAAIGMLRAAVRIGEEDPLAEATKAVSFAIDVEEEAQTKILEQALSEATDYVDRDWYRHLQEMIEERPE